jgi:hypothetical protein
MKRRSEASAVPEAQRWLVILIFVYTHAVPTKHNRKTFIALISRFAETLTTLYVKKIFCH